MSQPFQIVFPLFPGITQLDFTGPYEVFSRLPNARLVVASVGGGTLETPQGLCFANVTPLREVAHADLLCVPGGYGTPKALADLAYLDALRRLGSGAAYLTSVCTGSLLLGAAGFLAGRRAGCHWAWRDLLLEFGAIIDPARVVKDENLITGGGVTAGIDLALVVVAELAGVDFAEELELALEYAPEPPFRSGRPESARPETLSAVKARLETLAQERRRAVREAALRLQAGPAGL